MRARWGFDLDMSAIRLMRREGGHWLEVARETIDGADIEDRLMAMVERIDEGSDVHLFLPREQILYTDVEISSERNAQSEIEAAMDGRTPYTLDELQIDWVLSSQNTARVAAIAQETLDEAHAFAEARGLKVAGLSSLAEADDFPRMPDFGGGDIDGSDPLSAPATPQSTELGSEPKSGPEPADTVADEPAPLPLESPPQQPETAQPVVQVSDTTPVMQIKASPLPPLNPGRPLDRTQSQPRVRTDIAAGTLSGAAATLSAPGPSIRIHAQRSQPQRTLIVFLVAALLTVGIAIIVWSILPLSPGRTGSAAPEQTETATPAESTAELDPAPGIAPVAGFEPSELVAGPEIEAAPQVPGANRIDIPRTAETALAAPAPESGLPPQVGSQKEPRPAELADLQTTAPVQSLDGAEDTAETTLDIYIASIERRDLAFDAIALPTVRSLSPEQLPEVGQPPAPPSDDLVVARIAPAPTPAPERPTDEEPVENSEPIATIVPPVEQPEAQDLRQTELAAALPDRAPAPRPTAFVQDIEREQFGGRTRSELADLLPPPRPRSAQTEALSQRPTDTATELAVQTSALPRGRPSDFDAIVAAAVVQSRADQVTARLDFETPDTTNAIEAALADDVEPEPRPQDTPRLAIPSSASVARQATIEDAIPLNKINLVGVYGVPSDRRALVRLPSGRYVKVKVGDRVDGGTVAQINDSQLIYRKGSRTVALSMPNG